MTNANIVSSRKEAVKTVALFLLFCFIFITILSVISGGLRVPRVLDANVLALFLNLFGFEATAKGTVVTLSNGFRLNVIAECTAIYSIIIYSSCVLAAPTNLKNKGIGILFGVPALYALNMIRLVSTAFVAFLYPSLLEWVHSYLWQMFSIIFVILILIIWKDKVVMR